MSTPPSASAAFTSTWITARAESGSTCSTPSRSFPSASRPESPGITPRAIPDGQPAASARTSSKTLIERLRSEGKLVERKGCLALPEHREQFNDAEQQLLQNVEALFRSHPFDPPGPQEIADQMRVTPPQVQRVLRILTEQQQLVRVDQDLLFPRRGGRRRARTTGRPHQAKRRPGKRQIQVPPRHQPQVRDSAAGLLRQDRRHPPGGLYASPEIVGSMDLGSPHRVLPRGFGNPFLHALITALRKILPFFEATRR